jgi:hypothetical protein
MQARSANRFKVVNYIKSRLKLIKREVSFHNKRTLPTNIPKVRGKQSSDTAFHLTLFVKYPIIARCHFKYNCFIRNYYKIINFFTTQVMLQYTVTNAAK